MEGVHARSAQLLHVLVKPQVVSPVGSQIWLRAIQVSVPHFIYIYKHQHPSRSQYL
jgi:hypothetical protein